MMISVPQWERKDWEELGKTVGFIVLSLVFFRVLQFAVRWYLFGKCTFRTFSYFKFVRRRHKRSRPLPDSQSLQIVPPNKKWRISNEVVSLIHSVVSGLWALYACLMFPKLISEMDSYEEAVPKTLVYLSFGYLVHDLIDLLINERSVRIIELLFHHVIVITGFLVTLMTHLFLGLVMFGLLMELNSIFLHTRSLLNLYGQPKNSTAFKFVALLNVATFMVFRMSISAYLLYWQLTNAFFMEWYLAVITFVVIVSLTVTNTVLCYRVLAADGLLGKGRQARPSAAPPLASLHPIDEMEDELNSDNDEDESSSSSDETEGAANNCADLEAGERRLRSQGTDTRTNHAIINHVARTSVDECVGTDGERTTGRRSSVSIASQTHNGLLKTDTASPGGIATVTLHFSGANEEETALNSSTNTAINPAVDVNNSPKATTKA